MGTTSLDSPLPLIYCVVVETNNNRPGGITALPKNNTPTPRQLQAREKIKRETARRHAARHKWYASQRVKIAKAQDNRLRLILKEVSGKGIYDPKSTELTKYRRYRAKKVAKQYGDLLNLPRFPGHKPAKKFLFVAAPKGRGKEVKTKAETLGMSATNRGVFVERSGHRRAKIKESKKTKELYIELSGKTKRGPLRGTRYVNIRPLASLDELDREKDRLRELAKGLPLNNDKQRFVWKIRENGIDGYSHRSFTDIESLIRYLEGYDKTVAARINFFRHVELERTESGMTWAMEHPARNSAERRAILKRSRYEIDKRRRGR